MDMAASTLLTMALLMHMGARASIVTRMIRHLPEIDPALGNLIPVGDHFSDEEIHALAGQSNYSASLMYSASVDQFAYVIGCQFVADCIKRLERVEHIPALVIWPPNCTLHGGLFSSISLDVASRVG